jgi:hypothetical protein
MNLSRTIVVGTLAIAICVAWVIGISTVNSQPPAKSTPPEPAPPAGQTYTGAKQCSACHFKQYTTWKKTKHATAAWDSVPAKYKKDASCLSCHATGSDQPTGFKDEATSANLKGTTCEACHGPGSEHEKVCKPLTSVKKLSPEQEKTARDSIYKIFPGNVCQQCHLESGHREHPKYDK